MKKMIAAAAFVMVGLFAYTGGSASPTSPAAPAVEVEAAGSTAACPWYAPRCCAFVGGRCIECVGRFDQCP